MFNFTKKARDVAEFNQNLFTEIYFEITVIVLHLIKTNEKLCSETKKTNKNLFLSKSVHNTRDKT